MKETAPVTIPRGILTFTVDSFANGIAFGRHRSEYQGDPRNYFSLRLRDESELVPLRSRYMLHRDNPLHELERHLMRLSSQGVLRSSHIYLGVTTDPFFPFEHKFDTSMKFLELFLRYTPGMLTVQTRSPLIVIAMPVFNRLGKHCSVTIGIETFREDMVRHYTPGLPSVRERLKTAAALRRFGIETTLQAAPVLPYGDWRADAARFAEVLTEHADYIFLRPLSNGKKECERRLRNTTLAKKLAMDRKFHYLRPNSGEPLRSAIEAIAPEKLKVPDR
ncbi:MAG: hypothetical protein D6719_05040, partial [Candidatus Dadabacteria bacterium]